MRHTTAKPARAVETDAAERKNVEVLLTVNKPVLEQAGGDSALPGFSLLSHTRLSSEVMSNLLADWLGPQIRVMDSSATLLHHVPGKRCNFQIQLVMTRDSGGGVERRSVAGKIYSEDHGANVYRTLHRLWKRGFSDGRFLVPQPLAYDSDWKLLLLTWADGELLRSLLLRGSDASHRMEDVARWLLRLHHCGMKTGRRYTFRRHLHTLGQQTQRLAKAYPESYPVLKSLMRRLGERGRDLSGWTPGPCHRDFCPDHIVLSGEQLTAVDFDEFCLYDPLFDVAHFIAHLRLLAFRHFGALTRFDDLVRCFKTAYCAGALNYSEARIDLYEGAAYLKLAHITAALQPAQGWKDTVDVLLSEAERVL